MIAQKKKNVALITAIATKGITSRTLATQTGLSHLTISAALNMRCAQKPETKRAIAAALGVPQRSIFGVTQ